MKIFCLRLMVVVFSLSLVNNTRCLHLGSGPHLSDVSILLPPSVTNPVQYKLHGSDGCFKWSWDHHDLLSVLPEYNSSSHCSTSAHLKSIAPYSGRKETAVYATDVHSGVVIRCKVYIDNFARIQIFHHSIKLELGELATLRVRAFDSEGNVFSSLVGARFMWKPMPESDGSLHSLIHVPLKSSPLNDCDGICGDINVQAKLENSGVFSDLYVVKGTRIGHERVSVNLLEPMYDRMSDTIVVTVAEAMSLNPPSPVFLLVGATVRYNLKIVRGSITSAVSLPSPHHRWSVSNSSVSQVHTTTGRAYALNLGVTTVTVEDTRVAGHIQQSSLHVVLPDTLSLYILPLSHCGDNLEGVAPYPSVSRWYVVSRRQYRIVMKVFSQGPEAREIYITESDNVKLHDAHSSFWNMFPVSDNITVKHGWWNFEILQATSCGIGEVTGTLTYMYNEVAEVLKIVKEVNVCDQVMFSMDKRIESGSILLPWVPAVYQEMELKATGGCAKSSTDYKWYSSDIAIVSVSGDGIVQSKKPGKAIVKVVSAFDSSNFDEVVIEVSIPSTMTMLLHSPIETMVGSSLRASVTLTTASGSNYFKCDAFCSSVQWNTGSESFEIVNTDREPPILDKQGVNASSYGPPCGWTRVYVAGTGRTLLNAVLTNHYNSFEELIIGPILKASTMISGYSQLIVHQAGNGNQFGGYWCYWSDSKLRNQLEKLNLAPGTHMDVALSGGPEEWGEEAKLETVEILPEEHTDLEGVLVGNISTIYGSYYRISCQERGKYRILFKRGNVAGDVRFLPAVAEAELLLTCSLPSSISLVIDNAVNVPDELRTAVQAEENSVGIHALPIRVTQGRTIRVSAVGITHTGIFFGNTSSLILKWELRNCNGLAFWDSAATTKSDWERFLVLENSSGVCVISATVTEMTQTLSAAVQIQLVSGKTEVVGEGSTQGGIREGSDFVVDTCNVCARCQAKEDVSYLSGDRHLLYILYLLLLLAFFGSALRVRFSAVIANDLS